MISKQIEIYSTESCHFCHMAKDFLSANNIAFTDYDVGRDVARRAEMVQKSGQMGVPVIVIDGKEVVVGFNREALSSMLGIKA